MLNMRTTIDLTDEQRAELLKMAANRGLKGFSSIVQEALDEYLMRQTNKKQAISTAISLQGCLKGKEADEFEKRTKSIRELWRCS
jgi:Arc/MetJ family transcription regulator